MNEFERVHKVTLIDKIIDFIFLNDPRKWLILIFIFGFLLRFVAASNIPPVADEMVHGTHAIGYSKLMPLSGLTQGPVWSYLTDYGYRLFGIHLVTARLLSLVFGSLTIFLVYSISNMLFNKRVALIASFLFAISAFHITWTASYQDQTMMFFVFLASFFFLKEYKEKKTVSVLSSVFLGVAVLVKIITGAFILVLGFFMLFILYKNYKEDKKMFKKNFNRTLIFGGIILISILPIAIYNYFLFQNKGIVDLPFAQFLSINEEYYTGPGLAHEEGFVLQKLHKNLYAIISSYFVKEDFPIFILGILGIIFLLLKKKEIKYEEIFLIIMFFFALLFIASAIALQTHYTSFIPFLAIFGGVFLDYLPKKIKKEKNYKILLIGILILILMFNIYNIRGPLTSKSAVDKLRTFVDGSLDKNSLVVVDSRIYRGVIAWAFYGTQYIESSYFPHLIQISNSVEGQVPLRVFFIECINDDCGWGTIKDQPDFNKSVEEIVDFFKKNSQTKTVINGGGSVHRVRGHEIKKQPYFNIYETILLLNPKILTTVESTHNHFFYQIPRNRNPKEAFDYYEINGTLNKTINFLAYLVLFFFLVISVLSLAIPFYILYKHPPTPINL